MSDLTTIEKGKIGELAITSDCIQRGYNVYAPVADCDQVDLLVEIESGIFSRVHIKTHFTTGQSKTSIDVKLRKHSAGRIDVIGIYYFDAVCSNGTIAYIPYQGENQFILAVQNAKNNQRQSRNWIYAFRDFPEHRAISTYGKQK